MVRTIAVESTTTRAYSCIIEVPKKKTNQTDYVFEYDASKVVDPDDIKEYTTRIPGNKENRELLKKVFILADEEKYWFGGMKRKATKQSKN